MPLAGKSFSFNLTIKSINIFNLFGKNIDIAEIDIFTYIFDMRLDFGGFIIIKREEIVKSPIINFLYLLALA